MNETISLNAVAKEKFEGRVFKHIYVVNAAESGRHYVLVDHYVLQGGEVYTIETGGKLNKSGDAPMELFQLIDLGMYNPEAEYLRESFKLNSIEFLKAVKSEAKGKKKWSEVF